MLAIGAVVVVVGAMLAVTQISNAGTRRWWGWGHDRDRSTSCPSPSPAKTYDTQRDLATSEDGKVEFHPGDGWSRDSGAMERAARERGRHRRRDCSPSTDPSDPASSSSSSPGTDDPGGDGGTDDGTGGGTDGGGTVPPGGADGDNNGLEVLGRDCTVSQLEPHDGFQNGNRCVNTQFGEVGSAENNPSLLITEHPDTIGVNEPFSFSVSTRNLIRDRFLGAGAGGYYLESSFLNEDGLQRGHFHNACRLLRSTRRAPDPEPAPEFFVATEDGAGSARPDTVEIDVEGLPTRGTYQCASWAGDPSHRIPMMQRANQVPAFDAFRIEVR